MKKHFKLYKAGKLWLTAAIVAFGVGTATITANASDELSTSDTNTTEQVSDDSTGNRTTSQLPDSVNDYTRQDNNTYQNTKGQTANNWQTQGNDWYHFNNGSINTGWNSIDNNWYYMNQDSAKMETGLQKINNNTYYLNDQHDGTYGAMKTGWQNVNNNWYYFQNSGAATTGWYWSGYNWYYFDQDGIAKTGWWTNQYNNTYYFDHTNAYALTGWQIVDNGWHYFNPTNAWIDLGWQFIGNFWYFFGTSNHGQMLTGFQKIGSQHYYLNELHDGTYGAMKTGWQWINNGWYYFQNTGTELFGWQNINGNTYYLDPSSGRMATGNNLIEGNRYYFDPSSGHQIKGLFLDDNGLLVYYDNETGVQKQSLGSYTFDKTSGEIDTANLKNGLNVINGSTYYFDKSDNRFIANGWQSVNNYWYHFSDNGAANTGWYQSPAGNWYYFNSDGSGKTGWFWSGYNWYYFDPANAWAKASWFWSGYHWYYFDPVNAYAYTGYHVINGIEYYFDTKNAYMYQNSWVNVNGWTYHADNNGRLWFPRWYSQFTPAFYGEGCSVYSLAMLLSPKEYINIGYALSLLSYRQAGNLVTGAGFSLIIQPNSLVELAHHFDSSVRNISGSSVQDIINIVNSGHPVQYYGYSSYERSYAHRNHNKVIVGYQNGYFRIFDPCYWSVYDGWYSRGGNAFDYGAKSWVSVAQFSREYAGQAITVD